MYSGTSVIRAVWDQGVPVTLKLPVTLNLFMNYVRTWLYKNTGHKYIKHKYVYKYGIRNIYESGWAKQEKRVVCFIVSTLFWAAVSLHFLTSKRWNGSVSDCFLDKWKERAAKLSPSVGALTLEHP